MSLQRCTNFTGGYTLLAECTNRTRNKKAMARAVDLGFVIVFSAGDLVNTGSLSQQWSCAFLLPVVLEIRGTTAVEQYFRSPESREQMHLDLTFHLESIDAPDGDPK